MSLKLPRPRPNYRRWQLSSPRFERSAESRPV
jgi:hypothetical protein